MSKMQNSRATGRYVQLICTLGLALPMVIQAQSAAESNTQYPPNTSAPKNFEGVWWPSQERVAGAPGGGAPQGAGGGERPVELTGSTLQCAPVLRMSGSGGGMTSLIIQSPAQLVIVSEEDMDIARKIYINGKHPANLVPQPNGHSIGTWDGDTLVVDSIGYSGKDGKDNGQHVVERLAKTGDILRSEATTTDKNGTSRKQNFRWIWRPDLQFNENVCEEGFDRYQVIDGKLDNPNTPPSRDSAK